MAVAQSNESTVIEMETEMQTEMQTQKQHFHISHKMMKSRSTSEWSVIMKIVNNNLSKLEDTNILLANSPELGNTNQVLLVDIMALLDKIVVQLDIDKKLFSEGILDKISDCALHAPRYTHTQSMKNKPIRLAQYCAKKMFIDTGKMPKQEWANIHWQRLVAKLSRAFIEQEKIKAIRAEEFKTARLLQHQRKGWCELKKRTIAVPVGRPTAMKVDISPLEELEPFFTHLATNGIMYSPQNSTEHQEFIRGAVYPDGRMDLCKQVVGPTWIGALMTALKTNTQVEHFLLGNNITNIEGGRAIGEFLATPRPNKIKTWYLAGSEFSSKALEHIIAGFLAAGDNDVSGLWLKRNPLYAEGMRHIRKLLESNESLNLKVLDLHNTAIGLKEQAYSDETNNFERHITDNGIKELCEGLKVNEVLENLYLGANALKQSSINYLADYFQFKVNQCRPGIKSLWLDMNKLTDEGCKVLCESLANYPIRVLELGSNFISEDGMAHIARCFRNHSTLEVLHLGLYKATADMGATTNNIGDAGVPAICELMENNTSIRHLDISMNNISNEGMTLITASLEKNTTLWYMNYKQYGHNTDEKNVQKIADLLERNREPYRPEIEFGKNHERRFIHGDNIWTIDSIYRNSMK